MILTRIKDYLRERRQATLAEIALHCGSKPDAVRGMLEVWMRKGRVSRHLASAACGSSCHRCDSATMEVYIWQEPGTAGNGTVLVAADCSINGQR